MYTNNVGEMLPLVRLFENLAEWLGLSRNSGSLLTVLYLEKYGDGQKLSLKDLAEATCYSRSNVTLILSQLETFGILQGEADLNQTGRGRRRILYSINDNAPSPIFLLIRKMEDRLRDSLGDMENLRQTLGAEVPHIDEMLDDFSEVAHAAISLLSQAPTRTKEK